MFSALGLRGPGSIPGAGDIVLCSWARHFTLLVLLSRCINGFWKFNAGGNPGMD